MRNNGPKKIALMILLVAVIGLTVAFAMLSSNLNISGSAYVDPVKWGIYFDELSDGTTYNNATLDKSTKAEIMTDSNGAKTKIGNMNVNLSIPGDKVVYTVDLVNEGTIPVEISGIKKPDMKYDFITFKVTYTGTNDEVSIGNVIEAGSDGQPAIYNLTITINYDKELVNELPTEELQIGLSYELEFKQTENSVNKPTTKKKFVFPEVSGKLGDNITFRYYKVDKMSDKNEYAIDIKGSGDMYDEKLMDDSECKEYSGADAQACSLGSEISIKVLKKLGIGNTSTEWFNKQFFPFYIMGNENVKGMISKKEYKDILLQSGTLSVEENGFGLTQKQLEDMVNVLDNIPTLKNINIDHGITSIRSSLFAGAKIDHLKIPDSVTKYGEYPFYFNSINSVCLGTGVKDLQRLTYNCQFNSFEIPNGVISLGESMFTYSGSKIVIPSTVVTIDNKAFYESYSKLIEIVNKTGSAFDWNALLGNSPSVPFITGKVTTGIGNIITIKD